MTRKIQKLRSKRGFTMVELIIVIAIIAIMATTVLAGSSGRREKILEANTTASDFYSAIQAEFTGFQMFDGPLTMTLNDQYNNHFDTFTGESNYKYLGMKYYPDLGGNYPFDGTLDPTETHQKGAPKDAALYVEFYTIGGRLRRVNFANDLEDLLAMTGAGNKDAELSMVLLQEMDDRMEYRDGFYYARISYKAPVQVDPMKPLTSFDYRTEPIRIDWTAFSAKEMTDANETFLQANMLNDKGVCGIQTTAAFPSLGVTGTSFLSAGTN